MDTIGTLLNHVRPGPAPSGQNFPQDPPVPLLNFLPDNLPNTLPFVPSSALLLHFFVGRRRGRGTRSIYNCNKGTSTYNLWYLA